MGEIQKVSKEFRIRKNWFTFSYDDNNKVSRVVFQDEDNQIIFDGTDEQVNELFEAMEKLGKEI